MVECLAKAEEIPQLNGRAGFLCPSFQNTFCLHWSFPDYYHQDHSNSQLTLNTVLAATVKRSLSANCIVPEDLCS